MKTCTKRNTKKCWSLLLTVAMLVGMIVPSTAATKVKAGGTEKTYIYKFSANDLTAGDITEQTTYNVNANVETAEQMSFVINPSASGKTAVKVESKSKTVGGESFTKWINLQGAGDATTRSISFTIPENAVKTNIKVYAISGKTSVERKMNLSVGGEVKSQGFKDAAVWEEETTATGLCYVYGSDSLRVYGITVEVTVSEDESQSSTNNTTETTTAATETTAATTEGTTETTAATTETTAATTEGTTETTTATTETTAATTETTTATTETTAAATETTTATEATKAESTTTTSASAQPSTSKAVVVTESAGWLEEAYAEWNPVENASGYNVYVKSESGSYTQLDKELVRKYSSSDGSYYYRADAVGLAAGSYVLKIVPVISGAEATAQAAETSVLTVSAHDRTGFAWVNGTSSGAYNEDGTLKSNAVVLYITEKTKDTVSLDVVTDAKGKTTNAVGLQNILNLYKKGYDSRPLDIRLIGQVTDLSTMEGGDIVISGSSSSKKLSCGITIEGIGEDATVYGWGIRIKNASNVEVRNLGIMLVDSSEGDNVGLQQDNDHIWVHNCDFFYGEAGGDSDQAKGDGALDCKKSTYITFSYNHFYDNGKCNLLGLSEKTTDGLYITYHHNWYDHSDSRHPRVRYYSAHVYNNYYDGNAKYGIGACLGSSIFAEGNYFRNCKYPMLTSMQGHDVVIDWTTLKRDVTNNATFSKEDGGTIKAYNNKIIGGSGFTSYQECNTEFDAYVVESADETVPSTVTSYAGGNTYNNFDTSSIMYSYTADDPDTAKANVEKYAGRVNGGDFSWTFTEADDESYAVNTALKAALRAYKTSFVCVAGTDGLIDTDTATGNEGSSGGSFGDSTTTSTTATTATATTTTAAAATDKTTTAATESTTQASVSKTYTFDAANESVITKAEKKAAVSGTVGTDGFFTLTGTVTRSNSSIYSAELGKQESGALEFTVTDGAEVTFSVSSTGSSNSSDMALIDAAGNRMTAKNSSSAVVVLKGADAVTVKYTGLAAGTYRLVSPSDGSNNTRGFRVISAVVTQTEATTTATVTTETTKSEDTATSTTTAETEGTKSDDTATATTTATEGTKSDDTTTAATESTKPEATTTAATESTKSEAATTATEATKSDDTATSTTDTTTDVVLEDANVENAEISVVEDKETPAMTFTESNAAVLNKLLTAEERIAVKLGNVTVSVGMKVEAVSAEAVKTESDAIKNKVDSLAEKETIGMYFDITVEKKVGSNSAVEVKETPNGALSISMELPTNLLNTDSLKTRSYSVVRYHVDEKTGTALVDILPCSFENGKITFESDKFSVYAVIYSDSTVSDKAVTDTGSQIIDNSADTSAKSDSGVTTGDKVSLSDILILLGVMLLSASVVMALVKKRKVEK